MEEAGVGMALTPLCEPEGVLGPLTMHDFHHNVRYLVPLSFQIWSLVANFEQWKSIMHHPAALINTQKATWSLDTM